MSHKRCVQQFARVPMPGRVKTRLQPEFSAEEACAIHIELMQYTALALQDLDGASKELWLDVAGEHPAINSVLAAGLEGPHVQSGADLGARMASALAVGLRHSQRVVLVGSDCPVLDRFYLESAFAALETASVVLGPAEDGGFVLVGCTQAGLAALDAAFENVEWGGGNVLKNTLTGLRSKLNTPALLSTLYDVDTAEDLRRWRHENQIELGVGSNSRSA